MNNGTYAMRQPLTLAHTAKKDEEGLYISGKSGLPGTKAIYGERAAVAPIGTPQQEHQPGRATYGIIGFIHSRFRP